MAVARITDEEYIRKYGAPSLPARPQAPPIVRRQPGTVGETFGQAVGRGVTAVEQGTTAAAQTLQSVSDEAYRIGQDMKEGYRQSRGLPATSPSVQNQTIAPTVARPADMVGGYTRELTPGGVRYTGPAGSMEGRGTGGGTYSEYSGPGRGNMTQEQWNGLSNEDRIARNVASYESQTQAIRDARNAGRVARGERLVGERAAPDSAETYDQRTMREERNKQVKDLLNKADQAPGPKAKAAFLNAATDLADTIARPGENTGGATFDDQLGLARYNLDAARAETSAEQGAQANQIASMREARESALAGSLLEKQMREADADRINEIENNSVLGTSGIPSGTIISMERQLQEMLPGVNPRTTSSALEGVIRRLTQNGKIDPAKVNERELIAAAAEYIKAQ